MRVLNYLIFLILPFQATLQDSDPISILKEKAIPIKNLSELSSNIYNEISNYNVIMLGEMHGTNEPAEFAFGLCELIVQDEEKVILALEIPSKLMDPIPFEVSIEQLKAMEFFQMENYDGRNSDAWLELIKKCSKNKSIEVKFIDNTNISPRDSSMYLDVVEIRKQYPKAKIITLTGNIHNYLKPFRDETKLGGYLMKDINNFNPEKIMSINHMYKGGTMMNNMGNGLELKTVEGKDNFFNKTIKSKMYLCPRVFEKQNQYTHFLYTEKVTHSNKLKL